MVNIVLIVFSVIFALLIIAAAVYFLVYFQHPNDKWVAWVPKVVVVFGLSLSAYNIFLLPLDVANQSGQIAAAGQIPMATITLVFYLATVGLVTVGVPFTVFYYEGVDDNDESDEKRNKISQVGYALKWLIPTVIMAGIVIGIMFWQLGYAKIPTTRMTGVFGKPASDLDTFVYDYCQAGGCTSANGYNYPWVSVVVYIIAMVSFVGWLVFSIFGGIGLVSLPYDMIMEFQHRPKPITAAEYADRKKAIGQQAELLKEVGTQLQEDIKMAARSGSRLGRRFRTLRSKESEFRKDVLILEFHYRRLEEAYKMQGGNILLQYVKFILAIFFAILSGAWLAHIGIYLIPTVLKMLPLSNFLNTFFETVSPIPFIGTAFYAIFTFYLLLCVLKGNQKAGMRLFFITIHPLVIGETMMNSLVFNTGVILISSLSVAQFCTLSFSRYARYTASNALFGVQIQNLYGIQYAFIGFIFLLLLVAGLTITYIIYKPYNKQRENRMNFKW